MDRMLLIPRCSLSIVAGPSILRGFNKLNVDLFGCESKDGTLRLAPIRKRPSTVDFVLTVNSLRYFARYQIDGKGNAGESRQERARKVPCRTEEETVKDAIQQVTTNHQPKTLSYGKLLDIDASIAQTHVRSGINIVAFMSAK